MKIETDLGAFEVRRPSLAGWKALFEAVPREDVERLIDVVLAMPDETKLKDVMNAGRQVLDLLPRVPQLAAALLSGCLMDPETRRRPLSVELAGQLDDVALDETLQALRDDGVWEDLIERLKKWLTPRPARGTEAKD